MTGKIASPNKRSITSMSEEAHIALVDEAAAIIREKKEREMKSSPQIGDVRSAERKPGWHSPEFLDQLKNHHLASFAAAEEAAAKEVDPKKAERILVEASADFYDVFGQGYFDYVGLYPLLVSTEVSSPGEYYRDDFDGECNNLLEEWVRYGCHNGPIYHRLTTFGKWFMNTPDATLEDIRELLEQYKRGEAMSHEIFFIKELEEAISAAEGNISWWKQMSQFKHPPKY